MGERASMTDLMAWNADGTRMPWRMHSEYLYRLYLDNELATNRFPVGGKPCHCGLSHLHRHCTFKDMWSKDENGKWGWIGGPGWVNGKKPAAVAKVVKTQAGKAVTIKQSSTDSDTATQLAMLWEETGGTASPRRSQCSLRPIARYSASVKACPRSTTSR